MTRRKLTQIFLNDKGIWVRAEDNVPSKNRVAVGEPIDDRNVDLQTYSAVRNEAMEKGYWLNGEKFCV